MKNSFWASLVLSILLIAACKTSTNSSTGTVVCTITSEEHMSTDSAMHMSMDTTVYVHNSGNYVVSIVHGNSHDSLIYNLGILVSRLNDVSASGAATTSFIYAYAGGDLSTVTESGTSSGVPYTKVTTLTYSAGQISAIAVTGDPNGQNPKVTNVNWSGGNVVSADVDFIGQGAPSTGHVTTVYDTKLHYRNIMPTGGLALLEYFSTNNLISAQVANAVPLVGFTANQKFVDRQYTYTTNGGVNTRTDNPSPLNNNTTIITTYAYDCK